MPGAPQDVHYPFLGLDRSYGFQTGPLYTTPSCLNVRNDDVFESRMRGGSRPGLTQVLPPKAVELPDIEAATIEIVPTKDTHIHRHDNTYTPDDINTDYGSPLSNNLKVGCITLGDVDRGLFHFDLSNVPTGAIITVATFLDLGFSAPAGHDGDLIWVRRLTQTGWSETLRTGSSSKGTTSWTRYDFNNTLSWITAGGDYTTDDQVGWALSDVVAITGLAAMAQEALNNQNKQLHMILMRQDEGSPSSRALGYEFLNSRNSGPINGPRLSVSYE